MPRCENWQKQNNAFEKANKPAEAESREHKCHRCQEKVSAGLLRIAPANHLGKNRAWTICDQCRGVY